MNHDDQVPRVELRGIGKSYRGTKAVDRADFVLRVGEIHGLVGENGAGKSTLSGIVSGGIRHDAGDLLVDGESRTFHRPSEAQVAGISRIAQEISLVPQLSVAENVFLGSETGRERIRVARRVLVNRYRALLDDLGFSDTEFDVDPERRVGDLSISDQQKVEIVRSLGRGSSVIILDEPTSALGRREAAVLLEALRRLRLRGLSMIYVSHILEDVLEVCDTVTVMRDGLTITTMPTKGRTPSDLISAMLGRTMSSIYPAKTPPKRADDCPPALEVRTLSKRGDFDDISLNVYPGEIVGLTGLVGSGRSEILRGIFGADRTQTGEVWMNGRQLERRSPRRSIRNGLIMLTESRRDDGMIASMSIKKNITISSLREFSTVGFIDGRRENSVAKALSDRVDIRQRTISGGSAAELSGGNQQKMLFARWLVREPRVMLIDEPTRGVDVGAREGIYGLITEAARNGVGILVVSSEMEEALELCHRAYVIRQGSVVTELREEQMTVEHAVSASFGQVRA